MISTVGYSVEEVINDYNNGYSIVDIANKYATTSSIIRKVLKDNGVSIRNCNKENDVDFIQYVLSEFKQGKTVNDISDSSGASAKLIRKILKKNKLNADVVKTSKESKTLSIGDYENIKKLVKKGYSQEQISEMYSLDKKRGAVIYKKSLILYQNSKKTENKPYKEKTSYKNPNHFVSNEEEEKIKQMLLEGKSKRSISKELNRSYNVITRIEKQIKGESSTKVKKPSKNKDSIISKLKKTTVNKEKSSQEDTPINNNSCFSSYEEKKEYLDKLYGEGKWKILTREEISELIRLKMESKRCISDLLHLASTDDDFYTYKDVFL